MLTATSENNSLEDDILRVQIRDAIIPPNEHYRLSGGTGVFRNSEMQIIGDIDPMIERLLRLIKELIR